jgi:1-hydroxy-2-methyl-2-(E)-butenyl 4-diphosphate synthase
MVGGVQSGGGAAPVVQSMTLTKTHDVEATIAQIAELASAGCEIVRVAVPKSEDADALSRIVRFSPIPVIADIHFNASLALRAIEAGVAAVRINPGNIGGADKVEQVVRAAKAKGTPMRIGANSGSLPKHLADLAQQDQAEALVEAALEEVRVLERLDYRNFKISVKSSHVPTMIRAYRLLADKVPYPLHLGVTEAGTPFAGSIKSAVGMGALLADGIGDTIRVSRLPRPVHRASEHRHLERLRIGAQPLLDTLGELLHADVVTAAARARDHHRAALAQAERLQDLERGLDLLDRVRRQRDAQRVADAVHEQRARADGALDRA